MNVFILTLDEARRPERFPDSVAAAVELADKHPNWQLVKKMSHAWELGTSESLEAVRGALPSYFTAWPMVYATAQPPSLTVEALRAAVSRRADRYKD